MSGIKSHMTAREPCCEICGSDLHYVT